MSGIQSYNVIQIVNIGVPGLSLVTGTCQAPFVKAICLDVGFLLSPDTTPSNCLGKPDADSGTASSDTLVALEVSGTVETLHGEHIMCSVSRLHITVNKRMQRNSRVPAHLSCGTEMR